MRYRKRPIVIEALQLQWDTWNEMCEFIPVGRIADDENAIAEGCYIDANGRPTLGATNTIGMIIATEEGPMLAKEGDWIIKGVRGEYYACRDDIFKLTYDPVGEGAELDVS